jgi:hypothetical protein
MLLSLMCFVRMEVSFGYEIFVLLIAFDIDSLYLTSLFLNLCLYLCSVL